MLERERASWTWVWPRHASHSPLAATTMKWRLLMLGRSATLPWVWQEGWASKKNSNFQQLYTNTSKELRSNFFAFDPLSNFSTLSYIREISAAYCILCHECSANYTLLNIILLTQELCLRQHGLMICEFLTPWKFNLESVMNVKYKWRSKPRPVEHRQHHLSQGHNSPPF